jgi:hypothetical protein
MVLPVTNLALGQDKSGMAPAASDMSLDVPGDGKTLPESVARFRVVSKSVTSKSGFDSDGKKTELGLSLNVQAEAFVAEYGLSDALSLQMVVPYIMKNDLALDGNKFRQSDTYAQKNREFLAGIEQLLIAKGICATAADCDAQISAGLALPIDTAVTLPTGESLTIEHGIPLSTYSDALIVGAARPVNGLTGIGDIEVGALYAVYKTSDITLSAGGGLRFPTGSFEDVPSAQRGTGAGITTLGIRLNADYVATPGVLLAWQNQSEMSLTDAKKSKSSLIDNSKLNMADPESAAAVAGGSDGEGNKQKYEANGIAEIGFVRAGVALGLLTSALNGVSVNTYYTYNLGLTEYLNGKKQGDAKAYTGIRLSGEFNGLAYQLPFGLVIERETPLTGKNLALAPTALTITAKIYYRF